MKRAGIILALAATAGAIWYLERLSRPRAAPYDAPPPPRTSAPSLPAPSRSAAIPAGTGHRPIDQVTKLADADARKQLAERIASARSARATHAAPLPRLTTDADTLAESPIGKTEIRAAMREVVPHIIECYEAALPTLASPDFRMTAELTLTGDPDIGTMVDARQLFDAEGKPLPATLDDCFRSQLVLLALPPLAEGDRLDVRYPFVFRAH